MANIYGVRKVNEQIFSAGREPVITELDDKQIDTKSLTEGTLRVTKNADLFIWKNNKWQFCDNLITPTKKTTGQTAVSDDTQTLIRTMKTQIDSLQQQHNNENYSALKSDVDKLKALVPTDKNYKIDASRITGTLNQNTIPSSVKKHFIVVRDSAARKKLTSLDIQAGDTVYEESTGLMYLVKDSTFLQSDSGYQVYTSDLAQRAKSDEAGNKITETYLKKTDLITNVSHAHSADLADRVQHVTWKQIEEKPELFAPAKHTQSSDTITKMYGYKKASSADDIMEQDSLNTAIGKLEAKVEQATVFTKHIHKSSDITKLDAYEKQKDTAPLSNEDSLNTALGKLEYRLDHKAETNHKHASEDIVSLKGFQKFKPDNAAGVPEDISEFDSLNTALAKIEYAAHNSSSSSSKAAKRAVADEDGNNIKSTYATKKELAKKVDLTQIQQSITDKDIAIDQKVLYIPTVNSVREFVTRRDNIVQKSGQDYTDKKAEETKQASKDYTDKTISDFLKDVFSQDYFEEQTKVIVPIFSGSVTDVSVTGDNIHIESLKKNKKYYIPRDTKSITFSYVKDGLTRTTDFDLQDMNLSDTWKLNIELGTRV